MVYHFATIYGLQFLGDKMESSSAESLLKIIQDLWADPVAYYFLVAIMAWFFLAVFVLNSESSAQRRFISITPTSLTTLGLLGTFMGILIGLAGFDVNDIDGSVPKLLDGMKVAFGTSVAGIISAISFKLYAAAATKDNVETREITPTDIYNVLKKISEDTNENGVASIKALDELRSVISSDKDTSLLTQVQKLRTTVDDGQKELIKEFKDFAEHMVENNQKAIIEALENLIKDFNEKLTEQFGENFKQLNEAVEKLVEWQDRYKEILEEYDTKISQTVEGLENSERALVSVKESSEKIPEAVEKLNPVTTLLIEQLEVLSESLEAVKTLREKTDNAFPEIEENLSRITNDFANSVSQMLETSSKSLSDSQGAYQELEQGYAAMLENANQARENFSTAISQTGEHLTKIATEQFKKHSQLIDVAAQSSNEQISKAWSDSSEKMNAQFEEFDRQLQQELTRAMEQLGQNFASISEKFVSDYTPLTEKLRELVSMSGRAN